MSTRSVSTAFVCIIALFWCSKSHACPPSASVGAITPGQPHAPTCRFAVHNAAAAPFAFSAVDDKGLVRGVALPRSHGDGLGLVQASFAARAGTPAFNPDVELSNLDSSALADALDPATVGRQVPAGTPCK